MKQETNPHTHITHSPSIMNNILRILFETSLSVSPQEDCTQHAMKFQKVEPIEVSLIIK